MKHFLRRVSVAVINTSLPEPYKSYGDHWVDGFRDAGCDVTVFKYEDIEYIPAKFDLYFFVEIRYNPASIPWFLNPRVLYSWDSHLLGAQEYEFPARCFDKVLLASKVDVDALRMNGFLNVEWIPEACNPRIHRNLRLKRTTKLGFIGNLNDTIFRNNYCKNDFLNYLKEGPYKLEHKMAVYGKDYTIEQNKIQVMFDRPITYNIGTRLFESSAAGCVPLWAKVGYPNGIEELMEENVHYVSYNDTLEDVDRVLDLLFNNPSQIDKLSKAAEKHVLNNHTYAHRVRDILGIVGIKPVEMRM